MHQTPPPPALFTDGLAKRYGDRVAVSGVSVEVGRGEVLGLLGPNGAGKTTTIRMVCGLLAPTAGRALIGGLDVAADPIGAKRLLGYCPDQPGLYDRLTGRQMLYLAADLFNIPRERQSTLIEAILDDFALDRQAGDVVQSYSRGMRQKLGLCCALIHDPLLLVLDEPTVGLDPASARQLKNVILSRRSLGRSVLLSTHVLEVADSVCDRIAIIDHGRVLHLGTPEEVRALVGETTLEDAFLRLTGPSTADVR